MGEHEQNIVLYRKGGLAATLPGPCEILLHIFIDAIPASHEYDPSISQGPNSSWHRLSLGTKKALPLVCRAWNGPATEVLYRDVALRRVGEVQGLAHMLRACASDGGSSGDIASHNHGHDLSPLIRHIRIDAFLVLMPHAAAVKSNLAYILRRCTRLHSFHFHSSSPIPGREWSDELLDYPMTECAPHWLWPTLKTEADDVEAPPPPRVQDPEEKEVVEALSVRLGSSIRVLDLLSSNPADRWWGRNLLHTANIHPSLQVAANNLVSLRLGRCYGLTSYLASGEVREPTVVFNALEELYVYHDMPAFTPYMCQAWVLPRLKKLTLLGNEGYSFQPEDIIRAHGRHLRYLHLYPALLGCPWEADPELETYDLVPQLAELCAELQHLVLPERPASRAQPLAFHHPTLRFIDVWGTSTGFEQDWPHVPADIGARLRAAIVDEGRSQLPSLMCVRALLSCRDAARLSSTHLAPERHPDWPVVCHPSAFDGSEEDVFFRIFFGNWAVQTRWGVLSPTRTLCLSSGDERGGGEARVSTESSAGPETEGDDSDEHIIEEEEEVDLPDEMHPDPDMLLAVLEEQGLEYHEELFADAEYVFPDEDSDSDDASSMYDSDTLAE